MRVCQWGVCFLGKGVRTLASLPQLCFHHGSQLEKIGRNWTLCFWYSHKVRRFMVLHVICLRKIQQTQHYYVRYVVYPTTKVVGIHGHLASEYGFSIHHQGMALDVEPSQPNPILIRKYRASREVLGLTRRFEGLGQYLDLILMKLNGWMAWLS